MTLKIDYSKRDYEKVIEDLKKRIPEINEKWTVFLDTDIGFSVVKALAAIADWQSFYLDRQAAETFLPTCERRDSATILAKPLGYHTVKPSSAKSTARFSLSSEYGRNILIPEGTTLSYSNLAFYTTTDAVLVSGSLYIDSPITEGSYYESSSTGTGEPWSSVSIPSLLSDYIVKVNGEEWIEIDSFINATSRKSYISYEDSGKRVIKFGGGFSVDVPESGVDIAITGTLGSGEEGNVENNSISMSIGGIIYDDIGNPVSDLLSVNTTDSLVGGAGLETIQSIKENAPKFYTTQNRCVVDTDYEFIALSTSGVEGAKAWGGETVGRYGEVFVCVYGEDPDNVSQSLIDSVYTRVKELSMIPIIIRVIPPKSYFINLSITAFLKKLSKTGEVSSSISSTLANHFNSLPIGEIFQKSDIVGMLSDIPNLDYLSLLYDIHTFGQLSAEVLEVEVGNYVDETSFSVYDTNGDQLWSYGDGTYSYSNGILKLTLAGEEDQELKIEYSSLYDDYYPPNQSRLSLTSTKLTIKSSGDPT